MISGGHQRARLALHLPRYCILLHSDGEASLSLYSNSTHHLNLIGQAFG